MIVANRKTMRRSLAQANTVALQLRDAGHSDVRVERVTPTDWAITWTQIRYTCDGCGRVRPGIPFKTCRDGEYPDGLRYCEDCVREEAGRPPMGQAPPSERITVTDVDRELLS